MWLLSTGNVGSTIPNAGEDVEQQELSFTAGGMATVEDSLAVSYKTEHTVTYDPAVKFLGIYPKELKTYIHRNTYTQMFIAALFIVAKT